MIADPEVFADGHVPETLLHRGDEEGVLARAFEPALDGERPGDVLIHGPHGVGKTVLARHTFDRLQARADVDWVHVETMGLSTAGIVRAVLQALGADPSPTTSEHDLCLQLRERVDQPTIVVLDEGDDLPETALSRLIDVSLVGVVPIVHDPEDLLARLSDDRVRSRLIGSELGLDRYGTDELADILRPRVQAGLDVSVADGYLQRIADQAGGEARPAIQTLRTAAEIAAGEGRPIESVNVRVALEKARTRIRRETLASMPHHHQVLYALAWHFDQAATTDLQERYDAVKDVVYRERDQMPIGERRRRDKLRKLDRYDLVDWEHGRVRVVDKAVQPLVDVPAEVDQPTSGT